MISHFISTLPFRVPANDDTPASRRQILEHWREQAPACDSKIFHRRAETDLARLEHLAEELRPLMTWRRLREAAESDGVGTNWMAAYETPVPANDDAPPSRPLPQLDLKPQKETPRALVARLGDFVAEERPETILRRDEDGELYVAEQRTRLVLAGNTDGKWERHPSTQFRSKPRSRTKWTVPGGVSHCGEAVFSGPDHRRFGHAIGTLGYVDRTHRFVPVAEDYDMRPVDGEGRGSGKQNNNPPPPVPAPDIETIVDARQTLALLLKRLVPQTVLVLDTAIRARSFEDVGTAAGYSGEYAKKAGKRVSLASCEALHLAMIDISRKCAA